MSETIKRDPTDRSPAIEFDFDKGAFRMSGESYPEDAAGFFGPLLQAMREFVAGKPGVPATLDIEMAYFNSSSAKALMNLFQLLESAAASGRQVVINWRFREDDDTMREFGEDFGEDFEHARFNLCPISAS
jgi:hypothetical protein